MLWPLSTAGAWVWFSSSCHVSYRRRSFRLFCPCFVVTDDTNYVQMTTTHAENSIGSARPWDKVARGSLNHFTWVKVRFFPQLSPLMICHQLVIHTIWKSRYKNRFIYFESWLIKTHDDSFCRYFHSARLCWGKNLLSVCAENCAGHYFQVYKLNVTINYWFDFYTILIPTLFSIANTIRKQLLIFWYSRLFVVLNSCIEMSIKSIQFHRGMI